MERFTNFLGKLALGLLIAGASSAIGQTISPASGPSTSLRNGASSLTLDATTGGTTLTDSNGTTIQLQPSVSGNATLTTAATGMAITSAFGLRLQSDTSRLYLGLFDSTAISRAASHQFKFGDGSAPDAYIFSGANSVAGTDTNTGGGNVTYQAGNGTGTGTLSSLILQSPVAVGSGTGAQTQTTGLTIKGGQAVSTGYTVATLPAGITGGRAHVTDQLTACPSLGGTFTGGGAVVCPAFYNGTAWVNQ